MCIFYKQHSVLRTHLWREENFPRIIKDFIPVTVVQYIQIDNVLTELSTQNNCSFFRYNTSTLATVPTRKWRRTGIDA